MNKMLIIALIVFCGFYGQVFAQAGPMPQFPPNTLLPQQQQMMMMQQQGMMMGRGGGSAGTINMNMHRANDLAFMRDESGGVIFMGTDLFVDENTYYLGSGDVLQAIIWGVSETVLNINVVNEVCVIPSVGAIDVGLITLGEVKEKIISKIRRRYRADRIDVFLVRVKEISTPVQGEVNNPGTYIIPGNLTISSIIEQIGGATDNANLREIQLIHPTHGTRVVDIVKANRIADYPSANLRNGDRIFVPRRDLRVSISGEVQFPGDYDFVEGDKLSDLIKLSGGMFSAADSSRIIITRFVGQRDEIKKITLTTAEAGDFALEKDDLVLVSRKAEYRPVRRVRISGEVNFPGVYSIQENQTRLIDIITQAGGLTERANLSTSKIVRRNFVDAAGAEQNRLRNLDGKIQITPVENNFLKFRANGETQISIDFSRIKMERNLIENVILREGDEIHISQNEKSVNVMGAVLRPGLIEFSEGKTLDYYIEQAGGYKQNAVQKKMRVIKAGSNVWLKPRQVKSIEQGDAIWIPEKDFVERQERQQDVAIRGGVIGIIGGIATTIMATITIIEFAR